MTIANRLAGYRAVVMDAARAIMSERAADDWMETPNAALAGQRPSDLMEDVFGARMVLTVLKAGKAA